MTVINNKYHPNVMELIKSKEDEIISAMKDEGCLPAEIASRLDISMPTLRKWNREYKEFHDIFELGLTHSMAWWIKKGKAGMNNTSFNFNVWQAVMKNSWGWSDNSADRCIDPDKWEGGFEEKIKELDDGLKAGRYSPNVYEKMMKSLSAYAFMLEIIHIQPMLQKQELERAYKDGEITKDEFNAELKVIDRLSAMRNSAAELIFDQPDLYGKFPVHGKAKNKMLPGKSRLHRREEINPEIEAKKIKNLSMSGVSRRLELKKKREQKLKKFKKLMGE